MSAPSQTTSAERFAELLDVKAFPPPADFAARAKATRAVTRSGGFLTGDLAVRHPDGYVEIRDRSKDIIVSGGSP
jgi:acyl-CoA synthetase (AMP-forming)/AMP-acid ligase II